MTKTKLEIFRGDTQAFDLAVTMAKTGIDVTGWVFTMTAKTSRNDPDSVAVFQVPNSYFQVLDAARGLVRCTVPAFATAGLPITADTMYEMDVQAVEPNGAPHTIVDGTVKVKLDVTRTV